MGVVEFRFREQAYSMQVLNHFVLLPGEKMVYRMEEDGMHVEIHTDRVEEAKKSFWHGSALRRIQKWEDAL